ncbi:MAG: acyltransferase [Actinomycetota bacterium]
MPESRLRRAFDWLMDRTAGRVQRYLDRPRVYHPHPDLRGSVTIGAGTIMERGVRIDGSGEVVIGRNCIFSHRAKVISHSHHRFSGEIPDITAERGCRTYRVEIGDNVFLGEDAIIMPQAGKIERDAVIGIRAVVTKPVGPGEIWAGNPAVRVGHRLDGEGGRARGR